MIASECDGTALCHHGRGCRAVQTSFVSNRFRVMKPSVRPLLVLFVCLYPICRSVSYSICLSIYLSVCLSVRPSVRPSVRLSNNILYVTSSSARLI